MHQSASLILTKRWALFSSILIRRRDRPHWSWGARRNKWCQVEGPTILRDLLTISKMRAATRLFGKEFACTSSTGSKRLLSTWENKSSLSIVSVDFHNVKSYFLACLVHRFEFLFSPCTIIFLRWWTLNPRLRRTFLIKVSPNRPCNSKFRSLSWDFHGHRRIEEKRQQTC